MDPLLGFLIVLLWSALVALLLRGAYRAMKGERRREATILSLATIAVVAFGAEWIVFLVWMLLCFVGLPWGCVK